MKVHTLTIKETEFNGVKVQQLYLVLDNGDEYLIGTLKPQNQYWKVSSVNCIHREFKKNKNN